MNRSSIILASVTALSLGAVGSAQAQPADDSNAAGHLAGPQQDIGVRLSESSVLHVGVTAEGGYDTNVFYSDANQVQSALIRVIPRLLITNAARDGGETHVETVYELGVSLLYREYVNSDPNVRAQRGFNPNVHGSVALGGAGAFKLSLADEFTRTEDPNYNTPGSQSAGSSTGPAAPTASAGAGVGGQIIRDNNLGFVNLGVSPGGGRLTFTLRYTNTLDYYETVAYKRSSNMYHEGLLDGSWKWLPKTAIYFQGAVGLVHYLNPDYMLSTSATAASTSDRHDSVPIRGQLGVRGLVTPKTTVSFGAGYATSLYQGNSNFDRCSAAATSCNPKGLANLLLTLDVGYQPSLLSRIGLGLQHGYRNSAVIGDFYDLDAAMLNVSQMVSKLVLGAFGRYEYRRYHGFFQPTTMTELPRRDHVVVAGAQLDYYLQKWIYAGVAYSLTLDRTNQDELGPAAGVGLDYTKQQVFARIGVTY
jgi:hypothetical protein